MANVEFLELCGSRVPMRLQEMISEMLEGCSHSLSPTPAEPASVNGPRRSPKPHLLSEVAPDSLGQWAVSPV